MHFNFNIRHSIYSKIQIINEVTMDTNRTAIHLHYNFIVSVELHCCNTVLDSIIFEIE